MDPNSNDPSSLESLTSSLSLESPSLPESSSGPSIPPAMSPRSVSTSAANSATTAGMTSSSTPLGNVNAARRPVPIGRGSSLNPDIAAKMRAFALERRGGPPPGRAQPPGPPTPGAPPAQTPSPAGGMPSSPGGAMAGGIPSNFKLPPGIGRPPAQGFQSAPVIPGRAPPGRGPSLAEKRGLRLPGGLPGQAPPTGQAPAAGGRQKPKMSLADIHKPSAGEETQENEADKQKGQSAMDRYAEHIDKETGSLKFKGKAVISNKGIEFATGQSFSISLDEVDTLDEMGKGNYGTVYKVRHSRPQMRRPGQGLAGNKPIPSARLDTTPASPKLGSHEEVPRGAGTGVIMAMKEMRLELDEAKFASIIMELDILHRCVSPFIVDFYGAFFQEGAVYICMEFMDGGSLDKLYGDGIPENVLRKITLSTTRGLKSLKDEHNIIHRDVKPTNILVNSLGAVKICDFGVSGNLVASIAKTNIGCQSYMAPERISGGGVAAAGANPGGGTYSVQSDIWSLGLTIIECSMGRYPYPPETYDNIFSQLSAIVDGAPPDLPRDTFSEAAHNFVAGCLNKIPKLRPTYAMLLQHAWLAPLIKPETISEEDEEEAEAAALEPSTSSTQPDGIAAPAENWIDEEVGTWVREQMQKKREGRLGKHRKPALHAAPLDATGTPSPTLDKPSATAGAVAV